MDNPKYLTLTPGNTWRVLEVPGSDSMLLVGDTRCRGTTHYYHQSIYLDEGMLPNDKRRTLMHELSHAFLYLTQLNSKDNYTEEELCEFVSIYGDYIHKLADEYFDKSE